jgi:hypothetical protein
MSLVESHVRTLAAPVAAARKAPAAVGIVAASAISIGLWLGLWGCAVALLKLAS